MLRVLLAGAGPFVDGLQPHDAHQAPHAVPPCREPRLGQIRRDLTTAKERILRKYPVNLMHQLNCRLIKANRRVIDRGTADLEQLALARQAKVGVVLADHLAAFRRAHRFSPCNKKSFSTAS